MRSSACGLGQAAPADSTLLHSHSPRRLLNRAQLVHDRIRIRLTGASTSPPLTRLNAVFDAAGQQPLNLSDEDAAFRSLAHASRILAAGSSTWSRPVRSKHSLPPLRARLPNQAESVFNPTGNAEDFIRRVPVTEASKSISDLDYLTELMAIQQSDGPKNMGFFGTRNMGVTHQKLVEVLSYAYASMGNHLYTSGAIGTNAAVIKGALRANAPDKLTVILPQSLKRQPAESQELLLEVENLVEMPENDDMSLLEASRICNRKIIGHVQQVICFAFHDSRLLMETCHEAKDSKKIVTLFFLD